MVWWYVSKVHERAISGLARTWLRASLTDKFLYVFLLGLPWWFGWTMIAAATTSFEVLGFFGWWPWALLFVDLLLDRNQSMSKLNDLMARDNVVLATRAEYVGGHPELPHGRFAYVAIRGDQENPLLSVIFPTESGDDETFDMPLLDLEKTKPKAEKEQTTTGTILATLAQRPGKFMSERVTLNVDYRGEGGRKHTVELTSFYHGNDEIRNWRNYLVCAQAEADTGVTPHAPWKSLKPALTPPEGGPTDDPARDGSKVQPARRAFERR